MISHSTRVLIPIMLLAVLGAGCSSTAASPSASSPAMVPSSNQAVPNYMGGGDQAAKMPQDIPRYPGGMVIAVTGFDKNISTAQSTPDSVARVMEWVKTEYTHRGATLKSTSVEGMSTNLVFENSVSRYQVRIDNPVGGGGAFLTVSRRPK